MFVLYEKENQKVPVKVWLKERSDLEPECQGQAMNLANLPFAFRHVALMPDTHMGYGMPISGVLATEGVIIHLDERISAELLEEIKAGYFQVGTLGGGNHFIELQEDEAGNLSIMLHSGSRNFGYKICKYFNQRAKELNREWFSSVLPEWDLAFLPVDTPDGQAYIEWMNLALDFAKENRQLMMERVKNIVFNCVKKYAGFAGIEVDLEVNAHHNYAAIENHFGKNVWVHRKGAIRAREDEWGIIPGAMGSYSFIVKGLGNPESFQSCSHGAGRKMGRKEAGRQFRYKDVLEDLQQMGITLGTPDRSKITDECRWAYKEIDQVIANESDLVKPVMKLKTVAVIKAS